ncbi:S9 family peptidase [Lacimicrobium alkaliphilum]|uniref:Peptidase S9 n=1 Tax=Lacimicrobium alkaliphilum TaxID=1526571 RepID=A0ABQ1QY20_9ALTE|nr:prolyl oligopeptidase family serine peptidase [Lacimicrobium alkaliphilum]GGD51346.1 peptidase S9 [Lacimicrobium alkaliphilum]
MYKFLSILLIILSPWIQAQTLDKTMIQVAGPVPFEHSVDSPHLDAIYQHTQRQIQETTGNSIHAFGKQHSWQPLAQFDAAEQGLLLFKMTVSTTRFSQGELVLSGVEKPQVYVDGVKADKGDKGYRLALMTGEHEVIVLAKGTEADKTPEFEFSGKDEHDSVVLFGGDKKRLSMQQLYDSQVVSALQLSDDGEYALVSYRRYDQSMGDTPITYTELLQTDSQRVRQKWSTSLGSAVFSGDSKSLVYLQGERLVQLNLETLKTQILAEQLKDASGFRFVDKQTLVFSWKQAGEDDGKLVKRYQALEDRWSTWRDNSQLYQMDLRSGLIRQLTTADSTTYLLDVSPDNKRLLLMRSVVDYSQPPHGKNALFELNIDTSEERLIGEYRALNSARYSASGLYVLGGPNFSQGAGVALADQKIANDYDGQLYHMDLQGEKVRPLSKDFDPAISAMWVTHKDNLILNVTEQDKTYLYGFNNNLYTRLTSQLDVIKHVAVAKSVKPRLLYAGTTASSPQALYTHKPGSKAVKLRDSSVEYDDTRIPQMQEFDYVNARGDTIKGRVYLPHDLDETQSYPALVYYYGGTAPVTRGFTGRYPFNLWAAQGYVVYVLQPSGTFGFGQDFSARHVNAWGEYTSDDIIQGTQAFLKAYPFVNSDKVGHLGASYGGFMTMYLATRTDIFAASISHAGIANIASYWGEGWWGALYSGVASRGSFPWNNPQLYTQQSPLFQAQNITNPMLLIHGDADTNVPPGESQQMYTALKLLGKDVELVEYKGDNHHILTREKTFHWWSTMLAYFDMHLKEEPQWWQYLYESK